MERKLLVDQAEACEERQVLRRASDRSPLGQIVGQIEQAYGTGDLARAATLLEANVLHAWYGFSPEQFGSMLSTLLQEQVPQQGIITGMAGLLNLTGAAPNATETRSGAAEAAALAAEMFQLRLQGRPVAALRAATELEQRVGGLRPLFDTSGGWALFSAVQQGITAMLAGDFSSALARFSQARFHVVIPSLTFLSRDALVKSAVLHAAYGDHRQARALLSEAESIARTESWAETVIDASAAIARMLLGESPSDDAMNTLESVPLHAVGEMWPFLLLAQFRALTAAGGAAEVERLLAFFEDLPLPRREGEGYTGSVLPLLRATHVLVRAEYPHARSLLHRADASLAITGMTRAMYELACGRPREVLTILAEVPGTTTELRRFELWRCSLRASAYLALGDQTDCLDVLRHLVDAFGGVQESELRIFSTAVRQLAAEHHLAGWLERPLGGPTLLDLVASSSSEALTAREVDVLADLARGLSREEIAKAQFISINTLKAHLRSVYRKLDVNSRAAAVLEAERRGFLD